MNIARGCHVEGRGFRGGWQDGAAGKSAPADGWLAGFGRWNARQSHFAG